MSLLAVNLTGGVEKCLTIEMFGEKVFIHQAGVSIWGVVHLVSELQTW